MRLLVIVLSISFTSLRSFACDTLSLADYTLTPRVQCQGPDTITLHIQIDSLGHHCGLLSIDGTAVAIHRLERLFIESHRWLGAFPSWLASPVKSPTLYYQTRELYGPEYPEHTYHYALQLTPHSETARLRLLVDGVVKAGLTRCFMPL